MPIALAIIAVGYGGAVYIKKKGERDRFDALAAQTRNGAAPGTLKDVNLMLRFLRQKEFSQASGEILGKLSVDEQADAILASAVLAMKEPWAQKNLALALGARSSKPALEPLLVQLAATQDSDLRIAIWQALARVAGPSDVPKLLELHKSDNLDEMRAAESALVNAARQESNVSRRSTTILQAFRSSSGDDEKKASLIRVLGRLGSPESLPFLVEALENANPLLRNTASIVLGEWPNAEPIAALEAFLPKAKDSYIRTNAINSIGSLAPLSGEVPQDEIAKALITAYGTAKDAREQMAILTALARVAHPDAAKFCESLPTRDARQRQLAGSAVKSINAALAKITDIGDGAALEAAKAELSSSVLTLKDGAIINWYGIGDQVSWLVMIDKPGKYEIQISQAYAGAKPGRYNVTFGKSIFPRNVERTSSQSDFKSISVGQTQISKQGRYRLSVRPDEIASGDQLMRLQKVTLTRTGA